MMFLSREGKASTLLPSLPVKIMCVCVEGEGEGVGLQSVHTFEFG